MKDGSSERTNTIVYPFGATLGVARPAVAIATTTSTCLPQQRPIAATYTNPRLKGNGGKIAVIGSVHVFSDQYIEKEANKKWFENLIDYLTDIKVIVETDRDIEIAEYTTIPNVAQLSQQPRACLTESEEVPSDWTSLYQTRCNNYQSSPNLLT